MGTLNIKKNRSLGQTRKKIKGRSKNRSLKRNNENRNLVVYLRRFKG